MKGWKGSFLIPYDFDHSLCQTIVYPRKFNSGELWLIKNLGLMGVIAYDMYTFSTVSHRIK